MSDEKVEDFLKTVTENLSKIKNILSDLLSEEMIKRVNKALAFDVLEGREKGDASDYLWFIDLLGRSRDAENKKEFIRCVKEFISSREESYKNYPPEVINSLELFTSNSSD